MQMTMNKVQSFISKTDLQRLRQTVAIVREVDPSKETLLASLERKLTGVHVISERKIEEDIVTMNSVVRLQWLDTKESRICWLGFPGTLNYDGHKVSILSPLGIALLGARVGEVAEQEVPAGFRQFKVLEILYQPEAKKDYHL